MNSLPLSFLSLSCWIWIPCPVWGPWPEGNPSGDSFKSMCEPQCPKPFGLEWISCTHLLSSYKTLLNSSCFSQIGPLCLLVKIYWLFGVLLFVCPLESLMFSLLLPTETLILKPCSMGCMDIWCHWSWMWIWCMRSLFCCLVVLSTFFAALGYSVIMPLLWLLLPQIWCRHY